MIVLECPRALLLDLFNVDPEQSAAGDEVDPFWLGDPAEYLDDPAGDHS